MSEIERLSTMSVEEALTDEAILNTREVMRQLRPAIQPDAREATHRYYFRERFTINAYHFRVDL